MKRFFGTPSTEWEHLDGQLHVYHVPAINTPLTQTMARTARTIEGIDSIAVQPTPYFHATVQLLDWNLNQVSDDHVAALIHELEKTTQTIAPVDLTFTAPVVRPYAVETVSNDNPDWHELVAQIRQACTTVGCDLPAAPYGAHMSLAYGIAEGDDSEITDAMDVADFPVNHTIGDLHLVNVFQNRQAGVFEFTNLAKFTLRG